MDFIILDHMDEVLGYVVNAEDHAQAKALAMKETGPRYHRTKECESQEVPNNFYCCFMDRTSIDTMKRLFQPTNR